MKNTSQLKNMVKNAVNCIKSVNLQNFLAIITREIGETLDHCTPNTYLRHIIQKERLKIKNDAIKNGTYLQAPNGEKSLLSPGQWITVRTKRFKRWFGDRENPIILKKFYVVVKDGSENLEVISDKEKDNYDKTGIKYVKKKEIPIFGNCSNLIDRNGEPKVFFHCTEYEEDIKAFKLTRSAFLWKIYYTSFFSSECEVAEFYKKGNGRIWKEFINLRNPLIIYAAGNTIYLHEDLKALDLEMSLGDLAKETGLKYSRFKNISGELAKKHNLPGRFIFNDSLIDAAHMLGKDGFILIDCNEIYFDKNIQDFIELGISDIVVPLYPKDIKSANNNKGTFNSGLLAHEK